MDPTFSLQCPIPISDYPVITLAHGGGGRLTQMLIDRMFVPAFGSQPGGGHDGAMLPLSTFAAAGSGAAEGRLAFSTDSFVITPRFFPGGDIGSLAVHGTVNGDVRRSTACALSRFHPGGRTADG
jgi:hydrogenase expression/formation protein HypE